jgi:signal transduction histidine kinase
VDSDWIDLGTQRTATLSKLPPGHFRFVVAASKGDKGWDRDGTSLDFEVTPAWWETWWARTGAAVLACAALALLVRYWSLRRLNAQIARLEEKRRMETERTRIARDLHDGLGASLTQVGMLAEELHEDCKNLDEMKAQSSVLADRLRMIARDLDAAVWAVSPKNDTLPALCSYLGEFALEYFRNTRTRARVSHDGDIPGVPLSPDARHHLFLTAREALNNVLKHSRANEVWLGTRVIGTDFELTIDDDGVGFDPTLAAKSGRNGLENMRARVRDIGGQFEIASSPRGTKIRIVVPKLCPASNGHHPQVSDD